MKDVLAICAVFGVLYLIPLLVTVFVTSPRRKPDPKCAMCGGTGLTLGMPPCPCVRGEA